nr:furin (paired basic amino acid cleaving enzyme) b [Misgurnus anguillicaudatus]
MEGRWTLLLLLGAFSILKNAEVHANADRGIYTNTWAVHIVGGAEEAERIAHKHGFISHGRVFGDYYHFQHRGVAKRSLSGHRGVHVRLHTEPQVIWAEQQIAKQRRRRDIHIEPTDPKFPQQWYLNNPSHGDLNVKEAWAQGFTGRGVVVTILDDGIEKDHPDLAGNYDPDASYDVNDRDPDPQPRYTQLNDNRHGTRCAGEVAAAANNGVCGVGVAYNAKIGGVRMLDGEVTDVVEAQSLSMNSQHIHIYSASWGPEDDGKTVDGPAKLAKEAFLQGVTEVSLTLPSGHPSSLRRDIKNHLIFSRSVDACSGQLDFVSSLEHVQARLTLSYNHRGNLAIHLISPLGTRSTLLAPRPQDNSAEGFNDWAFMTTHSWDEDPRGEWTVEIENVVGLNDYGVLSQFTLILYGTGSSATDPFVSDYTRPSNNSCKTFDTQQICIECSTGFSLYLQGCVKSCPPGFSSGPQVLNLSLDNWVEHSTVQACLPCHPACLMCSGPGEDECLSCPPHSHLVVTSCMHQNQVQRKSPSIPVLHHRVNSEGDSGSEGGSLEPKLPSKLPALVAVLSCAFILATFAAVFVLLQLHSGVAGVPFCRRTKLPVTNSRGGGIRVGFGFGLGQGKVSYRGIPTVWGDDDAAGGMNSESDSEELEYHSEKTAFIRTQSAL